MVTVMLTNEQHKLLWEVVNAASYPGGMAEQVVALKQALLCAVDAEPSGPVKLVEESKEE